MKFAAGLLLRVSALALVVWLGGEAMKFAVGLYLVCAVAAWLLVFGFPSWPKRK